MTVRCRDFVTAGAGVSSRGPFAGARSRPRTGWPSWALLGLVLAGLFAMHGLGTHGTHAGHGGELPAGGAHAAAMGSMTATTAGERQPTARTVVTRVEDLASAGAAMVAGSVATVAQMVQSGELAGSMGGGLLGLCFAVLTALGAFLAMLRRADAVVARPPVPSRGAGPGNPGRDRDPPLRPALSVWRC